MSAWAICGVRQEYAVQVAETGAIQASKAVGRGIGTRRRVDACRGQGCGVEGSAG